MAGLALAGIAGCRGFTTWYLAEYPLTPSGHPPTIAPTLPPGTAVALAVLLAGGLWLALRPPPWLLPDRPARRFGIAMAVAMVAGFVLTWRLGLAGVDLADAGMISYLLFATPSVVLVGPWPLACSAPPPAALRAAGGPASRPEHDPLRRGVGRPRLSTDRHAARHG